jgi:hypothetical protein
MEELKACLFCGRYVDKSFRYCPYCGYEFGQKDDLSDPAGETSPGFTFADSGSDASALEGLDLSGGTSDRSLLASGSPSSVFEYLSRLQDMQELLSKMERDLDLIISQARTAKSPVTGPVRSSSKGP